MGDIVPEAIAQLGFGLDDVDGGEGGGGVGGGETRGVDPGGGAVAEEVDEGGRSGDITAQATDRFAEGAHLDQGAIAAGEMLYTTRASFA